MSSQTPTVRAVALGNCVQSGRLARYRVEYVLGALVALISLLGCAGSPASDGAGGRVESGGGGASGNEVPAAGRSGGSAGSGSGSASAGGSGMGNSPALGGLNEAFAMQDDDHFVIAGKFGTLGGGGGIEVARVDLEGTGELIWSQSWRDPSGASAGLDAASFQSILVNRADGSIYLSGSTLFPFPGNEQAGRSDLFVLKLDSDGKTIWAKQFAAIYGTKITLISSDSEGNVYAFDNAAGTGDSVRKLDSNGDEQWLVPMDFARVAATEVGAKAGDAPGAFGVTGSGDAAGNTYVATNFQFLHVTNVDFWMMRKLDPSGAELWSRQYRDACQKSQGHSSSFAGAIEVAADGTAIYATGSCLTKINAEAGDTVWMKSLEDSFDDTTAALLQDRQGIALSPDGADIYTTGVVGFNPTGVQDDNYAMRFDLDGNVMWRAEISEIVTGITLAAANKRLLFLRGYQNAVYTPFVVGGLSTTDGESLGLLW